MGEEKEETYRKTLPEKGGEKVSEAKRKGTRKVKGTKTECKEGWIDGRQVGLRKERKEEREKENEKSKERRKRKEWLPTIWQTSNAYISRSGCFDHSKLATWKGWSTSRCLCSLHVGCLGCSSKFLSS